MRFSTRFLRASVVALAFCACGRSDARFLANSLVQNAAVRGTACRFEPKAGSDALMTVGVTLDKQRITRVCNVVIDCVDTAMRTHSAKASGANTEAVREVKSFIAAFLDDPFKDTPAEFREFADEVGLRNVRAGWAVLSIGDVEFEFTNGSPEPKYIPEMAVAIAANIDMEKVVAYARRMFAEDKTNDAAITEVQIVGEKAWQIVPTTEEAKRKTVQMNLDPCFTSLDGQLVLIASTKAALEKQIRLYRRGMGEGRQPCAFRPANGDLIYLGVKNLGALMEKCQKDSDREKLRAINAVIPNGEKMILGLGDATVRLSENAAGKISLSLRLAAATAEDAEALRTMGKMFVMVGTAQLAQNPETPRQLVDSIQRWQIGGAGSVIEASHDDVLSMAAGAINFALQNKASRKSQRKPAAPRKPAGLDMDSPSK